MQFSFFNLNYTSLYSSKRVIKKINFINYIKRYINIDDLVKKLKLINYFLCKISYFLFFRRVLRFVIIERINLIDFLRFLNIILNTLNKDNCYRTTPKESLDRVR